MTLKRNAFVKRGVLGVALIVLLSTGAFAAGASTSGNAHTRGLVLFVGDSNVTISAGAIDTELTWLEHHDNGYVPVFASRVGASIRTPDCIDAANCSTFDYWKLKLGTILPKLDADAIVNDLGINDTLSEGTAGTPGYAGYGAKIDWFMGLVGDKPVFWTLLPCAIEPSVREGRVQAGECRVVASCGAMAEPHRARVEHRRERSSGIHVVARQLECALFGGRSGGLGQIRCRRARCPLPGTLIRGAPSSAGDRADLFQVVVDGGCDRLGEGGGEVRAVLLHDVLVYDRIADRQERAHEPVEVRGVHARVLLGELAVVALEPVGLRVHDIATGLEHLGL